MVDIDAEVLVYKSGNEYSGMLHWSGFPSDHAALDQPLPVSAACQ